MYFCLTGVKPDESVERMVDDTLQRPSMLGTNISQAQENALLRGMAVRAADRYQSMEELAEAFIKPSSPAVNPALEDLPSPPIPPAPPSTPKPNRLVLILCSVLAAAGLIFGGIKIMGVHYPSPAISESTPMAVVTESPRPSPTSTASPTQEPTPKPTPEPTPRPLTEEDLKYAEAEALLAGGRAGAAALAFRELGSFSDAAARSKEA